MSADIILNDRNLDIIGEKINLRKDEKTTTNPSVVIDSVNGNLEVGRNGTDGDLLVFGKTGKRAVEISAEKNRQRDDRTIYINGQDPQIEIKHFRKRRSGVFPKLRLGPTTIECIVDKGLPKFKLSESGAVFTTQVSVLMGSIISIARDITIRARASDGTQKTVNVHRDIITLKAQVSELKVQVAELKRRR